MTFALTCAFLSVNKYLTLSLWGWKQLYSVTVHKQSRIGTGQRYRINIENKIAFQKSQLGHVNPFTDALSTSPTTGSTDQTSLFATGASPRSKSTTSRRIKSQTRPLRVEKNAKVAVACSVYSAKPVKSQTFDVNNVHLNLPLSGDSGKRHIR